MTSPTQSAMEQQQREELRQILEFLYGADELDGCWYGSHPVGEPKYWWRSKLRAAIAKQDEELRSLRDSLALARSHIGELREALGKIATPGYGLELNDPIEAREAYWQRTLLACRETARAALNKEQP